MQKLSKKQSSLMKDRKPRVKTSTILYSLGIVFGVINTVNAQGPSPSYSTKVGKSHLDFSARWIHDFDVSNRVAGDAFNFSASVKF